MIAFLLFRLISGLWDDGNQRAVSYSLTDMLRSVDIFGYFSLGCSIGWWTSSYASIPAGVLQLDSQHQDSCKSEFRGNKWSKEEKGGFDGRLPG